VTEHTEARVPHDPDDLREAAKRLAGPTYRAGHVVEDRYVALADRLEAWADDMEREPEADLLAEVKRHRDANLVRAVLDGYGDQDEFVNEAINAKDFDRVPWLVAQKAIDHSQRLAPLEAAVLDALSEADIRTCTESTYWRAHYYAHNGDENRAIELIAAADRLLAAADALHALEAKQ
jgi:hypothetical protein